MQIPIISTTTIPIGMQNQDITGCFLVWQIINFSMFTRNLHKLSIPRNIISPFSFIYLRIHINNIRHHLLLSFLLAKVYLLLHHIVGLINLNGQLPKSKCIGTKILMSHFGRHITEQINLWFLHIHQALFEYPRKDRISKWYKFILRFLRKSQIIYNSIESKEW